MTTIQSIVDKFPSKSEIENALHVLSIISQEKDWIIDSGVLRHFLEDQWVFSHMKNFLKQKIVATVDDRNHSIEGRGDIQFF